MEIDIEKMSDEEFIEFMNNMSNNTSDIILNEDNETKTSNTTTNEEDIIESSEDTTEDVQESNPDDTLDNIEEEQDNSDSDDTLDNIEEEQDNSDSDDTLDNANSLDEDDTEDSEESDTPNSINDEEYVKLKEFYEKATADFKANGRIQKGLQNPEDIIRVQQKALGFDKLNKQVAPLKPYIKAMEESGLLQDTEKLNLAIEIAKGNRSAIIKQLEILNIDPMDLLSDEDSDDVKKEETIEDNRESELVSTYKEYVQELEDAGVANTFTKDIINEWDDESITTLLTNSVDRENLKEHISHGIYDKVMQYVEYNKRIDHNNSYSSKPAIEQYAIASRQYLESLQQPIKNTVNTTKQIYKKTKTPQLKEVSKGKEKLSINKVKKIQKASTATVRTSNVSTKSNTANSLDSLTDEEFLAQMRALATPM